MRSTVGQGSTFWFDLDLPVVEYSPVEHGVRQKQQRGIAGFTGPSRTILIADDNTINRTVVKNMLVPLGFEVIEAADGCEVLDKLVSGIPDLILMDLRMPEMDGFEVTQQLRQQPAFKHIIVIAISASVFKQTRQESFNAGCNDFLSKPFYTDDLLGKLHEHLNLEWLYEEIQEPEEIGTLLKEPPLLPPPSEVLAELYDLLMLGDVDGLEERARQIAESDGQYAPFVAKLCQLANEYRVEELRIVLEQYVEMEGRA